ncbi:MAG: FAD-dependent oxidoreductase [Gammaproteobacteria bacterium]|nr:FAD-dependent oxidoreductase [Gammaproteobacteria bacterium]
MKNHAEIVIIGGGVMGCSLAYHLCKEGQTDVILLEKGELTSGSTWHAAGQITHSVSHYALAQMAAYGTALYPQLERETGQSCNWHGCGSLRMAYHEDEVDWLRYTLSVNKGLGHAMEIIGPRRIAELHPFYQLDGVKAALHTPRDGHVDPAGVCLAMAKGARRAGATVMRRNRARGISVRRGGEFTVHTERGDITAHTVVNAGGVYARQIGQWVGLDLPIANLLHHYLVTDRVPEFAQLPGELPVVRDDREVSGYIRMEQQSGLIGIYEKTGAVTVWDDGAPWESENELFEADYQKIMPWLANAMARMPVLAERGIKRAVRGAITHPPDGQMLLGPSGVRNFWLCCGAQVGIAWGPGAGKYLAQWMLHGAADISMQAFDPRRFGAVLDDRYRIGKAVEDYALRHEIPYPARDRPACRPSHSRTSPLYETLKHKGAVYEEVFGWERPQWYAADGVPRAPIDSFRRTRLHDIIGAEVAGLRAHAGIADLSAFAKVEVSGAGAGAFLQRISSNLLPHRDGALCLTYFILDNGRIEGEATLLKLGGNRYYLVYAAAREAALLDWMKSRVPGGEAVRFDNLSEAYGVLLVAGPKSRDILAACTGAALDNARFPWLSARPIALGGVENIRAMRVTYTGELGWELHVPMPGMAAVYRALTSTGPGRGLVHVGSAALGAMRMEKGYRSGRELTQEVTMAEAGILRFARAGPFQGRAATVAAPRRWRLVCLRLDEPAPGQIAADPLGAEAVCRQGEVVGHISSGGYGYAAGCYLGFAYVDPATARAGTELEVQVLGAPRRAVVVEQPLRDPHNKLPRDVE